MTKLIEDILKNSKTIAMVGVSSLKKKEDPKNLKRKPSTIVMKYMQEFGYRVIPVNPFAEGEIIHGEKVFSKLEDNIFRNLLLTLMPFISISAKIFNIGFSKIS